jgi:ornithine cyclodeaminase/alanine dehydrogenase-like protein (mu-crystallin family)
MGIMENFRRTAVTDSVITTTLSNNNRTPAEGALDEKHTHEQETDEESLHKDHKLVVDDKERAQIDNEEISEGAQAGVKAVEAITSVWGKKSLWAAYIL